jgi:hypothetical protein
MPADPVSISTYLSEQIGHLSGELAQHPISDTIGIAAFPATAAPWQLHQPNTPVRDPIPPPPTLEAASAPENSSPFSLQNMIDSPSLISRTDDFLAMGYRSQILDNDIYEMQPI